jgi:hypothetical protein
MGELMAEREVSIKISQNGSLEFDCPDDVTGEELGVLVNEMADTYCGDAKCLSGQGEKCELCQIGDACHGVRKQLVKP